MDLVKKHRIIVIISTIVFFLLIIILSIFSIYKKPLQPLQKSANISNIDSCSSNIVASTKDQISIVLYNFIKAANDYNNVITDKTYTSNIRANSCTANKTSGQVHSTTAIVDVPKAHQSWVITYLWVKNGATGPFSNLGIGSNSQVSCPKSSQLRYGDFHCQAALNIQTVQNCGATFANNTTTLGYQNFGMIQTNSQPIFDASSTATLQSKLNSWIANQNSGKPKNDQIACVQAVANPDAQKNTPYVQVVTSWQVNFLTWHGEKTTHNMTYVAPYPTDPTKVYVNYFTLDGQQL